LPFEQEAVVDPAVCVSCGICAGACPTSTPFRRATALIPGIDLPHRPLRDLRAEIEKATAGLTGPSRVLLIGCDHGGQLAGFTGKDRAAVSLPCTAALPPSFIDYALSRNLADGIVITGCREGNCHNRFGITWMTERLARRRDPYLRQRVAAERFLVAWGGTADRRRVAREIAAFQLRLAALPPTAPARAKGEALNA
jgi:coenzyme F420-reducing hydrogenase delta subunit